VRILNLYAGIGGNRKLWGDEHDITAVEYDPKIAEIYGDLFPNDELVVGDAHEFLRLHHKEFDFIWSSPPCQTHSSFRFNIQVKFRGTEEKFPDMSLYEEILFLKYHAAPDVKWVIENVVPYYPPMLDPVKLNRHLYWANFVLPHVPKVVEDLRSKHKVSDLEELHGFDLSAYRLPNKRQVLRNVVSPETALLILQQAMSVNVGGELQLTFDE
jgi:DNA (cytosine-5)-methyltransferase 1